MEYLNKLEQEIAAWPEIFVRQHRFGGKEFRFRHAEVGHVHDNGILDIPFPHAVHDALLAEGLAVEHHWMPNSGWTTFHIRNEEDVSHALWLLRLSYMRYRSKTNVR